MLRLLALAVAAATGLGGLAAVSDSPLEFTSERALVERAAQLRAQGPAGLDAALERWDALTEKPGPNDAPAIEQMRRCVDLVAGQRDAWASRLYWYTSLDDAKAAAQASGMPILSLRMLGRLVDELSCANSRFFRTTLYANESVSERLRERFVLHWQSVRPVPVVTIDFGDGRQLKRTVTGNSAHYVLDAQGRPLDVLPGLYGPQAFESWLGRCEELSAIVADATSDAERDAILADYHRARGEALDAQFQKDLAATGLEDLQPTTGAAELNDDQWRQIAELPGHRVDFGLRSRVLMRREFPDAASAGGRAAGKFKVEHPLLGMVGRFTSSTALDAVKNEYLLHRKTHDWFATGAAAADVDALNERVYADLFLTPSSDPWLGLAPADAYTGLTGGGLTTTPTPVRSLALGEHR